MMKQVFFMFGAFNMRLLRVSFLGSALLALTFVFAPAPVVAQEDDGNSRATRQAQTLSPRIAQQLAKIYEEFQADNYQGALASLNQLLQNNQNMPQFDLATTLQLRGTAKANLEDYRGAIADFERAVNTGALPPETQNTLRFNIGQLYMVTEQWSRAIGFLKGWVDTAENPGSDAYYLLATAYAQLDRFRESLPYAERAVETAPEPKRDRYELLNFVYLETNNRTKRTGILRTMVEVWPDKKEYWTQLAGLLSEAGDEKGAFSVLELAYTAGRLDKCSEFRTLAQLYFSVGNSYRGGKMFEQEVNAGNCPRNKENLELLSQLWRDAREHKRAIPPLQGAASASNDGELFLRLGQTYYAEEEWSRAERAIVDAINKGGLKSRDRGTAWILLGNARYNQGDRDGALTAFRRAQEFSNVGRDAAGWIEFINAEIAIEEQQDRLEKQQKRDELEREIERLSEALSLCNLQGTCEEEGLSQADIQAAEERLREFNAESAS